MTSPATTARSVLFPGATVLLLTMLAGCSKREASEPRRLQAARPVAAAAEILDDAAQARAAPEAAVASLCVLGPGVVPELVEALVDGRRRVRWVATESLLRLLPERYNSSGTHLRGLLDREREQQSVWALGRLRPVQPESVAALVGMLRDPEFILRARPSALERRKERRQDGCRQDAGRPLPCDLHEAQGRMVREVAAREGIEERRDGSLGLRADLPQRRGGHPGETKIELGLLVEAIGKLGPAARPAVPQLLQLLESRVAVPPHAVVCALALIAVTPDDALSLIEPALRYGEQTIPNDAAILAARAGARGVPAIVKILESGGDEARRNACTAVALLGSCAAAAVPALRRLLADSSLWHEAVRALGAIGPAASEAVPDLVGRMLQEKDSAGGRADQAGETHVREVPGS